jgi:hypothetical protein
VALTAQSAHRSRDGDRKRLGQNPELLDPVCNHACMKVNHTSRFTKDEDETMANFGYARLVKQLDGKLQVLSFFPDWRWKKEVR